MKGIPEGKVYLIWILVGLWIVLVAEYSIYPMWINFRVNQGIMATDIADQKAYQQKIMWLGNVNKYPPWPRGWVVENIKDEKGQATIEAKGAISKQAWNRWLDDRYASPIPMTISSCQLRRLSRSEIFVTIRLTL